MRNPHLMAIQAGEVTATNVIGIRKALNAEARREAGYSVSRTAPKLSGRELAEIESELRRAPPRVIGALHASGLKLLTDRRYHKRLQPVQAIIDDLAAFRLIGFDRLGRYEEYAVPIYRAETADGRSFDFRNTPWQSGGNGPEVLS